ncbi:MAG: ABC transporter ATP-binding protein [Candidatus Dojkabacteria bacterium]|jgi:ABC-type multidrug transport system fused ATPase/permease subunit|nr:ABC transporter ATP-binding protein [Candidatus Dojkabacteria bacterium]
MKPIIQDKVKTLWKVVIFFYGRYPKEVVLRDLIFIAVIVAEMSGITIAGKFLDATLSIIRESTGEFNIHQYLATDSFYFLTLSLLLLIIVIIGRNIRAYIAANIADKVWKDTSLEVLGKISNSNLQDIEKPKIQNLIDFIPNYSINNLLMSYEAFSGIVYQVARGVTAFLILSSHLGWSVLFLVLFVLPEILLSHFNRKRMQLYDDNQMSRLKLTSYIYFTLGMDIRNFMELRVDNTYDFLRKRYKKEREEYLGGLFERRKHFTIDATLGGVSGQLFKYVYIVYLVAHVVINKITIGTFSALFNYVDVVYTSALTALNTLSLLDTNLSYASKYFEFVHYQGFGDENHGFAKLGRKTPSLAFHNLDFSYPDEPEKKVLENINLEINPGEKVAFFGGDGSGKSSLIKVLTGLYEVTSGDYQIGQYSVRELARGELKRKVSVTFQNYVNYNFSIRENITLTSQRKNIDMELYRKIVKVCEIADFMKKEKITDNLILGKYLDGKELSPGYWQRLAIARMLYRNREIFVMDEPFTFIDAPSREHILKGIIDLLGPKKTLILITRDTDLLDKFDRIYVFDNGHIVEAGDWKELIKKKGKFYKEVKYNQ